MTTPRTADCQVMFERLSAYLDRDLPAGECRTIEQHARGCPRCARVIDQLREATGLCHRAAEEPLPPAVRQRAIERARELIAAARTRPSRRPRRAG